MQSLELTNTEFEGQNNAYLLDGPSSTALVDTGIAVPDIREQLQDSLRKHGVTFGDVDDIILTHWHSDHVGLAGEIQAASDANVYVHEADAPLVRQDDDAQEAMHEQQLKLFEEWGMPQEKQEDLIAHLDKSDRLTSEPPVVDTVTDGDHINAGGYNFEVRHAPGHAAGQICLDFKRDGAREAFVGDVLLPEYTPNVGGADIRVSDPLETYRDTLRDVRDQGYERVWPGHRNMIEDPKARAEHIIKHHDERTERVLKVLRSREADAWSVSTELFGELDGIHILHGPGEAYAHLDWLVQRGIAKCHDGTYTLVDESTT